MALESKSQSSSGNSSSSSELQKEIAKLKIENARLSKEKTPGKAGEKSGLECYLCKQKGHAIRNCPDQCRKCSTNTKHVLASECNCADGATE